MTEQNKTIPEQVDNLLHDASRAFGGHEMAQRMGDQTNSRALLVKAAKGFAEALALDPDATTYAWKE